MKFFNEINLFNRRIKTKANFKDQTNKPKTEEDIFRKPTDKTWITKKTTILMKHLKKLQIIKSIKE